MAARWFASNPAMSPTYIFAAGASAWTSIRRACESARSIGTAMMQPVSKLVTRNVRSGYESGPTGTSLRTERF
jgi:hypothetical protein